MAKGSRYWAHSYIVLNDGRKFYLSNSVSNIEKKMSSNKKFIKFTLSGLFEETISIIKDSVVYYGSV